MDVNVIENGKEREDKRRTFKQKLSLSTRSAFHLACFIHHSLVTVCGVLLFYKAYFSEHDKVRELCVYSPAYATNWNIIFQSLFITLALTYDVLEWYNNHQTKTGEKIKYYRDVIFNSLVTPFTLFVSGMFWSVYSIDRDLVFPKVFDEVVPWWFNHCVHTNIVIIFLLETIITSRRYPTDPRVELIITILAPVLYAVVYYSVYFITNRWLYDVFGVMTWWQVVLYQTGIFIAMFICYKLQFPLNRLFHSEDNDVPKAGSSRTLNSNVGTTAQNAQTNGDMKENVNNKNASQFVDKEWQLKYRNIREQFEKTKF